MKRLGDGKAVLAGNAVTGEGLPAYGTQVLMNVINEVGALPARNHRNDVQFDGAGDISAEAMHREALERRQIEPDHQCGVLRLHDCLRAGVDRSSAPTSR